MAIISRHKTVNEIAAAAKEFDLHTIEYYSTPTEYYSLCHVEHQVTIPSYLQAAVLGSCSGARLMTIGTYPNVFESQCFITVRSLVDIWSGKWFYVHTVNLAAKAENFPEFMIVSSASHAPSSIVHTPDEGPCSMESRG